MSKENKTPVTEEKTQKRAMKIRLKTGVRAGAADLAPVHL